MKLSMPRLRTLCFVALAALLLVPVAVGLGGDPIAMSLENSLIAPGKLFALGSDHMGRDVLARIAHGFFWDCGLSFSVVAASLAVGVVLGLAAGYWGGLLDVVLVVIMDLLTALPHLVFAIVLMAYLSQGPLTLILALSLTGWVKYARLARAQAAQLREADFVLMEHVVGAGTLRILLCHLLPNVVPPLAGLIALHLGHTVLHIAALGFLGLGLQPPTPEWGAMILESRPYLYKAPWLAVVPGFFVFLFMMTLTLVAGRAEAARTRQENGGIHGAA